MKCTSTRVLFVIGWMLWLIPYSPLLAQQSIKPVQPFCGTPELTPAQALSLVQQANLALQRKRARVAFTSITYVPIRPHISRRSDGTGGFKLSSMNQVMAKTNKYFLQNGLGIQFYFAGTTPDYIDDDAQYAAFNAGSWLNPHDDPNAMNQYYVNEFPAGSTFSAYAYFPENTLQSTRSFIQTYGENSDNYDFGIYIVPHELGHNFDLNHTFGPGNGPTDELVWRGAGANCTTAGDLICDTPADPFYISSAHTIVVNGCYQYDPNSLARDANGDPYAPSISNIMSYYESCTHDFTPGQYDRMQAGLALRQTHTAYTLTYPATSVTPPTNLTASFTNTSVLLTWQDNANNEMGYFIERSTSPTTGFVPVGGVGPNSTTFTDTQITPNTVYYYRIRPSNTTIGSFSPTANVTTSISMVTGLVTTNITTIGAQLNWNSLGAGVTYDVQHRLVGSTTWNTTTGLTATNFTLYSLSLNTQYEWQVKASGNNTYSGPVNFTTPCPALTSIGSSPARTAASLYWIGTYPQTYTVQWRAQGAASWTTVGGFTTQGYSLTGLTSSTPYEWQVQATCPGSPAVTLDFSSTQSFTTTACQAPYGLTTYNVKSSFAQLSWYGIYDQYSPSPTYELRYRPIGTPGWTTVSSLTTTSYSLTGLANNTQYEWQVKSICSVAESSVYSSLNTFTTVCQAPFGISCTPSATGASLTWGYPGPPESSAYELQYRPVGNPNWTTVVSPNTNYYYVSRMLTGLATNTTYECRVRTVCSSNAYSDYTATATFTTGCYAPAPGSLLNSVLSSSAQLSWYLLTDAGTLFDVRYRSVGAADWTTISSLTATNYSITGLANNTQYEWQVRTVCSATESSTFTAGPTFTTRCLIPNLGFPSVLVTSASLSWSQGEPGAIYEVNYRPAGSSTWTTVGNLANPMTTLSGLTGSTAYEWQVRARCSDGSYSDFSYSATFNTASCSTPYSLAAATNVTSARLNWSFSYADASTRYEARYRVVGASNWISLPNLTSNNGSGYVDITGLVNNTQYEWQIRTICSATESSAFVSGTNFTTQCSIPTSLYASTQVTSATLYWNQPGAGVSYEVRYRLTGTAGWTTISNVTSTSAPLSGLTSSTGYEWQVKTLCSGNITSDFSSISSFTTVTCIIPNSLVTTNLTTTSARLNWFFYLANADTRYEGRYRVVGANDWISLPNLTSTNGSGTVDLTGLLNNTQYEWQIKALCSATESSAFSSSVTFRTVNPCPSMYTVKSGSWSDPTVWSCGRIPLISDPVQLKHVVTIPVSYQAQVMRLTYDAGQQLVFGTGSTLRLGQ